MLFSLFYLHLFYVSNFKNVEAVNTFFFRQLQSQAFGIAGYFW